METIRIEDDLFDYIEQTLKQNESFELKQEIVQDVKQELVQDVKQEIVHDVKQEISHDVKPEMFHDVKQEMFHDANSIFVKKETDFEEKPILIYAHDIYTLKNKSVEKEMDQNKSELKTKCCQNSENCLCYAQNEHIKKILDRAIIDTFYKCEFCSREFTEMHDLRKHTLNFHQTIKHKCDYCPQEFTDMVNLKKHMDIDHSHINIRPHYCEHCPRKFSLRGELRMHMKNVHKDDTHVCKFCKKEYKFICSLRRHVRDVHTHTKQPYDHQFKIFHTKHI